ncbi:rod shape-determining protein MreC [Aerosakkonema sp. BLCC-F183]|uniref:rod shape-determining protein MreC n=1 Tax=Aerosakkonema sp. BLCC-F183 TaxID=3342834 RepID=UPI0035B90415
MYTLRRWWDRNWLQLTLVGTALTAAWIAKQTQGAAIFELYQMVSRPFQSNPPKTEILADAKSLELQARLEETQSQNRKLQELLGYVSAQKSKGIVAPVVGRSADRWWQQITVGRGSAAGIKQGYIVTSTGGLVGRVIGVTKNTSQVLLISDASSRVGVSISRSRYMGVMRGQSGNRAVIQFFERVPDVRKGDVVATSSVSQFPSGVPVGRVESVNLSQSPAPEAEIVLSAPTSYLEWVVVHPSDR